MLAETYVEVLRVLGTVPVNVSFAIILCWSGVSAYKLTIKSNERHADKARDESVRCYTERAKFFESIRTDQKSLKSDITTIKDAVDRLERRV